MPRSPARDTADRILDTAERLLQIHGFNGFSYADIAAKLRVRNASIHYHFPSKVDLGVRLIDRYHRPSAAPLAESDRSGGAAPRNPRLYARLYSDVLRDRNRMCLCGMLASDIDTLPRPVRKGVKAFFDDNEAWLARVLEDGRKKGSLHFEGRPSLHARLVLSSLEGAMLVARSYEDVTRFDAVAERLVSDLEA